MKKGNQLPQNFKSWFQLARYIQNAKGFESQHETVIIQMYGEEPIEYVVQEVKAKAFEELEKVIPDFQNLVTLKHIHFRSASAVLNFHDTDEKEENNIIYFIDQLIELVGR